MDHLPTEEIAEEEEKGAINCFSARTTGAFFSTLITIANIIFSTVIIFIVKDVAALSAQTCKFPDSDPGQGHV